MSGRKLLLTLCDPNTDRNQVQLSFYLDYLTFNYTRQINYKAQDKKVSIKSLEVSGKVMCFGLRLKVWQSVCLSYDYMSIMIYRNATK